MHDINRIKIARFRADHYLASRAGEKVILDPVCGFSTEDIDVLVEAAGVIAPLQGPTFHDSQPSLL